MLTVIAPEYVLYIFFHLGRRVQALIICRFTVLDQISRSHGCHKNLTVFYSFLQRFAIWTFLCRKDIPVHICTVNCSNLGQPDKTWDVKKATILQNFQGPYFILPKIFAFKEIIQNREKRVTRNQMSHVISKCPMLEQLTVPNPITKLKTNKQTNKQQHHDHYTMQII